MSNNNKTMPTNKSVTDFIHSFENETKRTDAFKIHDMIREITGLNAQMWGEAIIGFGNYHYKYESGREGDFFRIGFSPRKSNFSLYIMSGFPQYPELLNQLGKYKKGKSCLYINKLKDIDIEILRQIFQLSFEAMNQKYP